MFVIKVIMFLSFFVYTIALGTESSIKWKKLYEFTGDAKPSRMVCDDQLCYLLGPRNKFMSYALGSNMVSKLDDTPFLYGYSDSLILKDGNIYVCVNPSSELGNAFWKFNIANGKWEKQSKPIYNHGSGGVMLESDGKIYLLSSGQDEIRNKAEYFDIKLGKWIKLSDSYHHRHDPSGFIHNNKIYLFGGLMYKKDIKDVEIYDISTNKWSYFVPSIYLNGAGAIAKNKNTAFIISKTKRGKDYSLYSWNLENNKFNLEKTSIDNLNFTEDYLPNFLNVKNRNIVYSDGKIYEFFK